MSNLFDAMTTACRNVGVFPPNALPDVGKWAEADIEGDKRGKGDARIKLFPDGEGGIVHNWKSGEQQIFFASNIKTLTPEQRAARHQTIEAARIRTEAELQTERKQAASKAAAIWKAATPAGEDHPYLLLKEINPVLTLREIDADQAAKILGYRPRAEGKHLTGRLLVAPIKVGDTLSTCELIDEGGDKSAIAGGAKAGGYWAAQPLPEGNGEGLTLLIGEGVATVLSAKEASGHLSIAALSAGNLPRVAKAWCEHYPKATLVILADLVKATGAPNPDAIKAARSVGALLAIPDFGTDRPEKATDFNDMAKLCGVEAAKRAIANASAPAMPEPQSNDNNAPAGEYASTVSLIRGSDITPEPVSWLWDGWLAEGKIHILGGAPGTGKTTISMALAATMTIGGRWPDGSRSEIGNVVIWSGEDSPADTLIPRLSLSGADLSRVYFVDDVREGNERRSFDPAKDMEALRRKLADIGEVRLLIVDPIVSAVAGDSHKNAEVRRSLQPLADLAASMRCAVLGITHFSKGTGGRDPVERLTGSLAFGALARVVLVAAKQQEEGEDGRTVRLFIRAKSNIGPDDGGFEYELHQGEMKTPPGISSSSVLWGDAVEGAARELLATVDATDDGEGDSLACVADWLNDLLAEECGRIDRRDVMKAAHAMGHKDRTVQRARKKLGLIVQQHGFGKDKRSIWTRPNSANPASIVPIVPNNLLGKYGTNGGTHGETSTVEVEI